MKAFSIFIFFSLFTLHLSGQIFPFSEAKNDLLPPGIPEDLDHPPLVFGEARLDSSHHWYWNFVGSHWDFTIRSFFTSDANGNILSKLEWIWDGTQWNNRTYNTRLYDANNNLINSLTMLWEESSWKNYVQLKYTFDNNNDLIEELIQIWDDTVWSNLFLLLYSYDSNHNILIYQNGEWKTDEWEIRGRGLYSYDSNNNLDIILGQELVAGEWIDDSRIIYNFNADHKIILSQHQKAAGAGLWEYSYQRHYTYKEDKTTSVYQDYVNDEWVTGQRNIKISNADGNPLSLLNQPWQGNAWVNKDSTQYYYTTMTSVKTSLYNEIMAIYPNPATTLLNIAFADHINKGLIAIYSNTGIKMMSVMPNPNLSCSLDISHLAPGSYHIIIHHAQGLGIRPFIKL